MIIPCVHLTLPTAVPLVAAPGTHKLGLALLAALAFWHFVFVELGPIATAGGDNHSSGRLAMAAVVARAVRRSMLLVMVIVALVDH